MRVKFQKSARLTSQYQLAEYVQIDMRVIFKTLRVRTRSSCSQCIWQMCELISRKLREQSRSTYSQIILRPDCELILEHLRGQSRSTYSQLHFTKICELVQEKLRVPTRSSNLQRLLTLFNPEIACHQNSFLPK